MDFADSPEHAAFRSEVRRWLERNLPPEICVDDAADQRVAPDRATLEKRIAWQKTMHAAGWVGISWLGPYAMVDGPTEAVPDASRWFHRVLGARQYRIAGGTSEIQRNIIGERVLGLPKG